MTHPEDKLQSFHIAALIGTNWMVAFASPFVVFGNSSKNDTWVLLLFAGLASYFAYTGIRAFKKGRRVQFIVRIVVPISLFILAWILIALDSWFT